MEREGTDLPEGSLREKAASAMTIQTSLKTGWLIRAVVMIVLGYGFAIWGFYDATVAYPKRGETFAAYMEGYWLHTLPNPMGAADLLTDPPARLTALRESVRNKEPLSEAEQAELNWLKALNVLGKLDQAAARVSQPSEDWRAAHPEQLANTASRILELDDLISKLTGQPKPLNSYDIPSQWVIVAVGLLIGTWSLVGFFAASRHKFVYDAEDGSLTIDGDRIPAGDMETIDKRRWQKKSIAYLITKDGSKHKLDDWIYAKTDDIVRELEKSLGLEDAPAAEEETPADASEDAPAGEDDTPAEDAKVE